jgi:hypothetical protein
MPGFDSSGTYTRWYRWQTDAANGVKIQADRHDTEDDGFATALSTCITKDGRTQPTADLPMNGKKITNLANPVSGTDAVNKAYVDNSTGRARISDTPPSSPVAGDLWWESDSGNLYCYYNDGDSLQWVQTNTPATVAVPSSYVQKTADSYNRIINGAMQVSQENGDTASAVIAAATYYSADQWRSQWSFSPGTIQALRSGVKSPNGSIYANLMGVGTAKASLAAADLVCFQQVLEGTRIADWGWGAAGAKQVVVRFWFRSNITGKFSFRLGNGSRSYVHQFDYTTVNAWQAITAVVPGDTAGTWPTDTSAALYFAITVAAGSTYTGSTVDAWQAADMFAGPGQSNGVAAVNQFYIADAGIYLDPNATGAAPPWVTPDYVNELAACRRYYGKYIVNFAIGGIATGASQNFSMPFSYQTQMRVAPATSNSAATGLVNVSAMNWGAASTDGGRLLATVSASGAFYGEILNLFVNARM